MPPAVTYIREDQAHIDVWINGNKIGDSWRTFEGGDLEADDAKTRPGGMGFEVSAGGPASRSDATLTTQFTDVMAATHPFIEGGVGWAPVKVGITWLKPRRGDGSVGAGRTIQGVLKSATTPDHGDGADVGMYTIVVSCDEQAG